jgi:ribosomal-protein-alanine N-acetyltransferase
MQSVDLKRIIELENELYSSPWQEDMFLQEIQSGYAFVLEDAEDKIILGYICGLMLYDEFNITNVAVSDQIQNQGYGCRLMKFIMQKAMEHQCHKFFLEVRSSNIPALTLYEKLGFKVIGVRKEYYINPPEDAIVMYLDTNKGIQNEK